MMEPAPTATESHAELKRIDATTTSSTSPADEMVLTTSEEVHSDANQDEALPASSMSGSGSPGRDRGLLRDLNTHVRSQSVHSASLL